MGKLRKQFSGKFKKDIALEAIRERKTLSELASEFGVHPTQISAWKKQLLDGAEDIFNDRRQKSVETEDKEKSKLFEQIGRLQYELDWVKKKSGL